MNFLRRVVDSTTSLLGKLKRHQRIQLPIGNITQLVKVNVGCGLAVAPGWINIDGSLNALIAAFPVFCHVLAYKFSGANKYYKKDEYCNLLKNNKFIHHNIIYGLPLNDNIADYVYSSHFIEHLSKKDASHLIKEMYRILKPGGVLRISVPDLEYAISLYKMGEKDKMLSSYFFVEDDNSHYARHKFMYDYDMLADALVKVGFKDIRRARFKGGLTPDLEILDNRSDESLFIEAVR